MNRKGYDVLKELSDEIEKLALYVNGLTSKPQYDFTTPERMEINDLGNEAFELGIKTSRLLPRKPPVDPVDPVDFDEEIETNPARELFYFSIR